MDKIREERDLLKHNQEKEDQNYWVLKQHANKFEALKQHANEFEVQMQHYKDTTTI